MHATQRGWRSCSTACCNSRRMVWGWVAPTTASSAKRRGGGGCWPHKTQDYPDDRVQAATTAPPNDGNCRHCSLKNTAACWPPRRWSCERPLQSATRVALATKYSGVLVGSAKQRKHIVPLPTTRKKAHCGDGVNPPVRHAVDWASLLRRVWELDALDCPRCHGGMTAKALTADKDEARRFLEPLGQVMVHGRARKPPKWRRHGPNVSVAMQRNALRQARSARGAPRVYAAEGGLRSCQRGVGAGQGLRHPARPRAQANSPSGPSCSCGRHDDGPCGDVEFSDGAMRVERERDQRVRASGRSLVTTSWGPIQPTGQCSR